MKLRLLFCLFHLLFFSLLSIFLSFRSIYNRHRHIYNWKLAQWLSVYECHTVYLRCQDLWQLLVHARAPSIKLSRINFTMNWDNNVTTCMTHTHSTREYFTACIKHFFVIDDYKTLNAALYRLSLNCLANGKQLSASEKRKMIRTAHECSLSLIMWIPRRNIAIGCRQYTL